MLRLALYFRYKGYSNISSMAIFKYCKVLYVSCVNNLLEVWVWSPNVDLLFDFIEYMLDRGLSLEYISTLDGGRYSVRSLSFDAEEFEQLGGRSSSLGGEVLVESVYGGLKSVDRVVKSLLGRGLTSLLVEHPVSRAKLVLEGCVLATLFYDNYLRVLEPRRIPP